MQKNYLILMRHGQSVWNKQNLFTGWVDIPLSQEGVKEAVAAGDYLKNYAIDVAYTSTLVRAQMTCMLALMNSSKVPMIVHQGKSKLAEWSAYHGREGGIIPVYCAWELNERMYGKLQGLNKAETMKKYGEEQVKIWRRSYDVPPPGGESLKETAMRALPYFEKEILPQLQEKTVFVSAHGNSLRAIIMAIEGMTEDEVVTFELPTGQPRIYACHHGKYHLHRP